MGYRTKDRLAATSSTTANLEQMTLLRHLLQEQERTNVLLKALVDMRSAELTRQGFPPHPLAR